MLKGMRSPARITVRLPEKASLYVDGVACPLTSSVRSFQTPALDPGQRYRYTLRAEVTRDGQLLRQTRDVSMTAGQRVDVRFNFTPASTARR
jgi:uncharacterized protein (TIGR03000 family)